MHALWSQCLEIIEKEICPENFTTWFAPTAPYALGKNSLTLAVPNQFFKRYLEENFLGLIETSLERICDTKMVVDVTVKLPEQIREGSDNSSSDVTLSSGKPGLVYRETRLSPKYSFRTFVVGSCNQFAHAASKAVANKPALAYNPLFIYGSVGLGKTHLLHAIGNEILRKEPSLKVRYISAEGFTIDLIQSLKKDKMNAFRDRYRPLDVLLVDDIQFLAGKDRTQEEFFYTFNELYESHKQVVITSDTFPRDMTKVKERLRSRFESGLIADTKPPDLETKVAILYKKSEQHKVQIPQDVAIFISGNIRSNIRELEGLLLRLIAYSSFTGRRIDIELAKNVLREFTQDRTHSFTIPNIIRVVATFFNIKPADIKSKKRSREISIPRQIAMFLCREYTKASLPEIGREFGGKDHTTVIYSYTKISNKIKENNELYRSIQKIINKIESE